MSATDKDEDAIAIARHLEQLYLDDIAAINRRDFHSDSVIFQNKSHNWRGSGGDQMMPLQDNVTFLAHMIGENPQYHLEVTEMSSDIDLEQGRATVFARVQGTGMGQGLETSSMATVEYQRFKGGKWLQTSHRRMRGFGDL